MKELIFSTVLAMHNSSNIPVMLSSTTGMGKTSLVQEFAKHINAPFHRIYAANNDIRSLYGILYTVEGELNIALTPAFQQLIQSEEPNVVFFDELNRANPQVINGLLFFVREGRLQFGSFEFDLSRHYRIAAINPANGLYNTANLDPAIISSFAQFNFNQIPFDIYADFIIGNGGFTQYFPEKVLISDELDKTVRSLGSFIFKQHSRLLINEPKDEFDILQKYSREKSPVILIPCPRSLVHALHMLNLFHINRDNIPNDFDYKSIALYLVNSFLPNELAQIIVTEYFERLELTWEIILKDIEKFKKFIDDELLDKANTVVISLIEAATEDPQNEEINKAAEVLLNLFAENYNNKIGQYILATFLGNMDMINELNKKCINNDISNTPVRAIAYFFYLTVHDDIEMTTETFANLIEIYEEQVGTTDTINYKILKTLKEVAVNMDKDTK